jgi:S1-C subfamily serine protease
VQKGSSILTRAAALGLAAVIGGGVALGGAAVLGDLGTTTTIREVVNNSSSSAPASFPAGHRLTINEIYRRSAPGVVQVTTTSVQTVQPGIFDNPFGAPQQQTQQALGSGFVLDKAGHVVTNYHVVAGAKSVQVSFSNNDSLKARIVGVDPSNDIAVLKVDAHSRALTPLTLGDSDKVQVGDEVVAIGNPLGLDRSVTAGIVSAVQRPIQAPNNFTIDHAIQTDAALNHGNSGGPLIDAAGEVIGVNSQISTANGQDGGNIGIGFAIPVNTVRTVAAQLIKSGKVEHAFLGIEAKPVEPQIAALFHLPSQRGLLVQSVLPSSGASRAGVKGSQQQVVVAGESWGLGGDIVVEADGQQITSIEQLRDVVATKKPGDTLKLVVYRGSNKISIDVKLGRQPNSPR